MKFRIKERNGFFYPQFRRPGFWGRLDGWQDCREQSRYIDFLGAVSFKSLEAAQEFIRTKGAGDMEKPAKYHDA